MRKQTQLFLVAEDEARISGDLKAVRPAMAFLDDNVWQGSEPVVAQSIDKCSSGLVYLWDRALVPSLPLFRRKDGRAEGPTAGVVVQLVRSRMRDGTLESGRIAAGTGGTDELLAAAVRAFITDVWRVFEKATGAILVAIEPGTHRVIRERVPEYRAGHRAIEWARMDAGHLFKDRSTENYFRPR